MLCPPCFPCIAVTYHGCRTATVLLLHYWKGAWCIRWIRWSTSAIHHPLIPSFSGDSLMVRFAFFNPVTSLLAVVQKVFRIIAKAKWFIRSNHLNPVQLCWRREAAASGHYHHFQEKLSWVENIEHIPNRKPYFVIWFDYFLCKSCAEFQFNQSILGDLCMFNM